MMQEASRATQKQFHAEDAETQREDAEKEEAGNG